MWIVYSTQGHIRVYEYHILKKEVVKCQFYFSIIIQYYIYTEKKDTKH